MKSAVACVVVAALAMLTVVRSAAQSPTTVVFNEARVDRTSKTVTVAVRLRQGESVAGYQFIATFDPGVLKYRQIENGDFIASTGREAFCPSPVLDSGVLRFACVTLRPSPAAASGDGLLATLTFDSIGNGDARFGLQMVKLVGIDGTPGEVAVQDSTFSVGATASSQHWFTSTPFFAATAVVGVAFILIVATGAWAYRRRRQPSPG